MNDQTRRPQPGTVSGPTIAAANAIFGPATDRAAITAPSRRAAPATTTGGRPMILDRPIALLRIEGFALAAAALALFLNLDGTWWWLPLLFLVPDLSAVGYLAGTRIGSMTYNAAHTTTLPIAVALIAWSADADTVVVLALIWLFHIGFDRVVGYGLKFPDAFGNTHLGMKGKRA